MIQKLYCQALVPVPVTLDPIPIPKPKAVKNPKTNFKLGLGLTLKTHGPNNPSIHPIPFNYEGVLQ